MLLVSLIYLIQRLWLKLNPPAYHFYRIYNRFTTESWMIELLGIGCDKAHCLFLSACETEQQKKKPQTEIKQERIGWGVRNIFAAGIEPWTLAERKERRRKSHSGMLRVTLWGPEIIFFWAETTPPWQLRQYSEHTRVDNEKSMLKHSVIHSVQDGGLSPSIPFMNVCLQ